MFGRRIRPNAQSVDRPGIDEYSPPARLADPLRLVDLTRPNNRAAQPLTIFRGDVAGPVRLFRPVLIPNDRPTPVQVAKYGRARHGEGLFGVESLIPAGEVAQ